MSPEGYIEPFELDDMLRAELVAGAENLGSIISLANRSRLIAMVWLIVQTFLLGSIASLLAVFLISWKLIDATFQPFVLPTCVMLCFFLQHAHSEYQRVSTELIQLRLLMKRLGPAISFAEAALGRSSGYPTLVG